MRCEVQCSEKKIVSTHPLSKFKNTVNYTEIQQKLTTKTITTSNQSSYSTSQSDSDIFQVADPNISPDVSYKWVQLVVY